MQVSAGKGGNSLCLTIPLCSGVISSDLFSLIFFFFFGLFLLLFFIFPQCWHFFPSVSPWLAPAPVIHQKPETGNYSGCEGLLAGHWSLLTLPKPQEESYTHSPFPYTDPYGKIPGQPEILQAEGPDGMGLGEFGLKKMTLWPLECWMLCWNFCTFGNLEYQLWVEWGWDGDGTLDRFAGSTMGKARVTGIFGALGRVLTT